MFDTADSLNNDSELTFLAPLIFPIITLNKMFNAADCLDNDSK